MSIVIPKIIQITQIQRCLDILNEFLDCFDICFTTKRINFCRMVVGELEGFFALIEKQNLKILDNLCNTLHLCKLKKNGEKGIQKQTYFDLRIKRYFCRGKLTVKRLGF